MKRKNTRFKLSQKAHVRLMKKSQSKDKLSFKDKVAINYHSCVYGRQKETRNIMTRTERKKVYNEFSNMLKQKPF